MIAQLRQDLRRYLLESQLPALPEIDLRTIALEVCGGCPSAKCTLRLISYPKRTISDRKPTEDRMTDEPLATTQ